MVSRVAQILLSVFVIIQVSIFSRDVRSFRMIDRKNIRHDPRLVSLVRNGHGAPVVIVLVVWC